MTHRQTTGESNMTNAQAYRLYIQYKTTTPAYKAYAAERGISTGDLNSRFCRVLNDRREARRLSNLKG